MSMMKIHNAGKVYRSYRSEWHRIGRWFGLPFHSSEENWVVRHVNFDMHSGESIGLIGSNGAGKSTLLKMITGTLPVSEGYIQVNGRISAILELGMGFNPELTGRQNAFHTAGLLGCSQMEIKRLMPEIEQFAEIGGYFDEPVRTYSSGMQMRVAFAVATADRSEILIVDEALAVGDDYFQHKCFRRIREFREQGTTLLIVSHGRDVIQSLCDRAILLEKGAVVKDGRPEEVFDFYNAIIAKEGNSTVEVKPLADSRVQTSSGTGEARVEEIVLYNSRNEVTEYVEVGEQVTLRIRVKVYTAVETLVLGYGIKDRLGQVMFGTNTWHTEQVIQNPQAGSEYCFEIVFAANFGVGSYSVQTALVDRDTHLTANYEWLDLALVFNVVNIDKAKFAGCLWEEPQITITECDR